MSLYSASRATGRKGKDHVVGRSSGSSCSSRAGCQISRSNADRRGQRARSANANQGLLMPSRTKYPHGHQKEGEGSGGWVLRGKSRQQRASQKRKRRPEDASPSTVRTVSASVPTIASLLVANASAATRPHAVGTPRRSNQRSKRSGARAPAIILGAEPGLSKSSRSCSSTTRGTAS